MRAPLPPDEEERLDQLRRLKILDTHTEESWNRIVRLAAYICGTPIALVSLIDERRQWFKARVGLEPSETDRDLAFCAHAIAEDSILEVRDATEDPRFQDNALVTGEPDIRFYAGVPVHSPWGQPMGTLCVIDRKPRELDEGQRKALMDLADQAEHLFELRYLLLSIAEINTFDLDADSVARKHGQRILNEMRHDLATPLTPMRMSIHLLQSMLEGNEEAIKQLNALERNVVRLDGLVGFAVEKLKNES